MNTRKYKHRHYRRFVIVRAWYRPSYLLMIDTKPYDMRNEPTIWPL